MDALGMIETRGLVGLIEACVDSGILELADKLIDSHSVRYLYFLIIDSYLASCLYTHVGKCSASCYLLITCIILIV